MSPKLVSIRTGEGDIWRYESEVSHHSDRKSGNPEVRVRSRSLFGQEKRKSGKTSPKSAPMRTEVGDIWRNESEVGQHSDRGRGYLEVRVRSQSPFGQEKRKSGGTSPKSVPIRTGKAEIRR
ncbi:hypothetical protein [Cytobacillus firmus]|uniref:hypothetical protein n=1 Tax=Cytobacillus firmus TaxID=1399 RepID=UPI00216212EE|nr:hypothetical protein [Cytobacillus firmus]MCS0673894.1 hypothetical protein [Cytobacillus firmus]